MKNKRMASAAVLFLLGGSIFAQELVIDFRLNTARQDPANYLTLHTPVYLIRVEKDTLDTATGASKQKSTAFLGAFQMDMLGRATISTGFRGLLLFPVAADSIRLEDGLRAGRESDGVITIEYAHRGVAYKISTDRSGKISFPRGKFVMRTIGYVQGQNPQVLSREFTPDGTAASLDWKKVWDPGFALGKEIAPGISSRIGAVQNDFGDYTAMYNWDGALEARFDNGILQISGSLKAVKR